MEIKANEATIKGLRVTVVDDNADCRDVVKLYLSQLQAEVNPVDSATDALKTLESFQPQIILSDLFMPERDGYWLIAQLRTSSIPYIPAIALTVAAKEEDRDLLILSGYDGYLAKPFLFEDLSRLINILLKANKN